MAHMGLTTLLESNNKQPNNQYYDHHIIRSKYIMHIHSSLRPWGGQNNL